MGGTVETRESRTWSEGKWSGSITPTRNTIRNGKSRVGRPYYQDKSKVISRRRFKNDPKTSGHALVRRDGRADGRTLTLPPDNIPQKKEPEVAEDTGIYIYIYIYFRLAHPICNKRERELLRRENSQFALYFTYPAGVPHEWAWFVAVCANRDTPPMRRLTYFY